MNPPPGMVSTQSSHATYVCPHCGVLSVHNKVQVVPGFIETVSESTHPGSVAFFTAQYHHYILRCVNCQRDTYFLYRPDFTNGGNTRPEYPKAELLHQYPVSIPASHPAVPASCRTSGQRNGKRNRVADVRCEAEEN